MNKLRCWTVGVAAALAAADLFACTGMYVGRKVSADGNVILARTVDCAPWTCCHRFAVTPRVANAPGRVFRSEKTGATWPLPETTWKFVSTPIYLSFRRGVMDSAAANERGLAITGTTTGRTSSRALEVDPFVKTGFGEESLPGLVANCCTTAREAVELLGKVVAAAGHTGPEIYLFADKDEAWHVEVYTGHQWAAVRMPEDKVACYGNQFMLRSFTPGAEGTMCSAGFVSVPEKAGLLVRNADGSVNPYETYASPLADYGNYRTWYGHHVLAPETAGEYAESRPMPLFFAPSHKVSVGELFELMRTRYEGSGRCPEETGDTSVRTIGTTKQSTCHVLTLDANLPAANRVTLWATLGNAEHAVFLPLNAAVTRVADRFDLDQPGPVLPRPDFTLPAMVFRRLAAFAELDRKTYGQGVRDFWRRTEEKFLREYPPLVKDGNAERLTAYSVAAQEQALKDAKRMFDELSFFVMDHNRIKGDGSGATDKPAKPFCPAGAEVRSDNLAAGKPYRLTRTPNYALSKDAGDAVQLTDGKRSEKRGYMWTDKNAVTWQNCRLPLGIVVDLGRVEDIAGCSMDFAAGASCVPYPDSILVYASDDGKAWRFLGDLYEKSRRENGAPRMDGYETYVAKSMHMPTRGRYVQFMVTAGAYFSTSEVEIFRGPSVPPAPATISDPLAHVQTCRIVQRILRDLERVAPQDGALRASVEALSAQEGTASVRTLLPLNDVHRQVWARNAGRLRSAGFAQPTLWTNDRWENLDPLAVPSQSACGKVDLAVEMMRGETRATAVNVLNPTDRELKGELVVEGLPDDVRLDCREVLFTDSKLYEPISGALKPGAGTRVSFAVPAGVSKQVWISFARPTCRAGTYAGKIRVTFAEAEPELAGKLRLTVCDLDFPTRPRVHLGGWDYSVGNCGFYKSPGNARANQAMMRDIYADTFWAPSSVRPKGAKFGADGSLLNADALDFRLWDEWVARFSDARRYAVFLSVDGMRTKDAFSFDGERVGTERFRKMVGDYFRAWRDHVRRQGVDPANVMFLLVDEPAEWQRRCQELPALIVAWAKAIKAVAPEFGIFEDPDYTGDPRQAGQEMYDRCDVLCLQTAKVATTGKNPALNRSFFVPMAAAGKELWLYACSGPSRTHDPISYYRQMFWLAYQWKAVGCGFWAFGCGGGIGDSWHAYSQPGVEYSPYFVSPTDVMAAKQSEAIKEGVQDYEYLKMLEDAVRAAKAKGADTSAAERLLETAPAQALNQTGADGREKYVRADSREWRDDKVRTSVEAARRTVLHELVRLKNSSQK